MLVSISFDIELYGLKSNQCQAALVDAMLDSLRGAF
jgi:hypothetical protein